ncbi:MAG TPA: hypothetical protein VGA21_09215 [Cyclobacteriaceae bacterium]
MSGLTVPSKIIGFGIILIAGFLVSFLSDDVPQYLVKKLNIYTGNFPQEKLYIQTDRAQYFAGDDIWLKIYLSNAETQKPDTLQSLLYLALVNDNQEIIANRRVKMSKGIGESNFETDPC